MSQSLSWNTGRRLARRALRARAIRTRREALLGIQRERAKDRPAHGGSPHARGSSAQPPPPAGRMHFSQTCSDVPGLRQRPRRLTATTSPSRTDTPASIHLGERIRGLEKGAVSPSQNGGNSRAAPRSLPIPGDTWLIREPLASSALVGGGGCVEPKPQVVRGLRPHDHPCGRAPDA